MEMCTIIKILDNSEFIPPPNPTPKISTWEASVFQRIGLNQI